MKTRTINSNDLEIILSLDRKIYPTDSPVQKQTLEKWYKNNPEFGMIFEDKGKIAGVFVVIPLNKKGWGKLVSGKLSESELDEKNLFDNSRDKEFGIHVYHLEKLDKDLRDFHKIAFEALAESIKNLKEKNEELKIIGFSGLCVSGEGIGLFENKFNCKEREFKINEHILTENGKRIIINSCDSEEDIQKDNPTREYVNRCKMLVLYPEEKSVVWDYLNKNSQEENFKENILKESEEPSGISVKGYDFNNGIDYEKILDSYSSMGEQATNFGRAIEIINKMRKEKAYIYLGYTSNMATSGVREIIRYLAEHKLVDVIVTSAGGIEEDFIKCLGDFKIGSFNLNGKRLREQGINRAGNILIPNSRYVNFENWVLPILEKHKNELKTPSQLITLLGQEIGNKESIYYWCWKNNIPVFCPALMDGSLGDMIYFFSFKNPDFKLDIIEDTKELNNTSIGKKKTGMIILGGGVVKHSICNANLYRNGADYAVYINSQQEFDGSDSGANPEEAKSWGKIEGDAESVKIFAEASLVFPLIVAKTFAK